MNSSRINFLSISLFVCFIPLIGCSWFDNPPGIEKDKQQREEIVTGLFSTYWKGAKISIRSLPVNEKTESLDFEQIRKHSAETLNLGKHLSQIYDWERFIKGESKPDKPPMSASDFLEFAQEVYAMSNTVAGMDEDVYPTLIEVLHHTSRLYQKEQIAIPEPWNNAMEHWMFALVMESRFGLGSWKTYELSRVNVKELPTTDYQLMANLHQGINHLSNQWHYLADESFSVAIDLMADEKISLQQHTRTLIAEAKLSQQPPEQQFRWFGAAVSHLLRGIVRHQSEDQSLQSQALADIESALKYFNWLGLDNEWVWLAESYVYISNQQTEKALISLSKLEKSHHLLAKEKALISETKKALESRDPNDSLNIITDKVVMYRLGLSYGWSYMQEIHWLKILESTEQGRYLLVRFSEIEQMIEKSKDYLSIDNLDEKGRSLLKEVLE